MRRGSFSLDVRIRDGGVVLISAWIKFFLGFDSSYFFLYTAIRDCSMRGNNWFTCHNFFLSSLILILSHVSILFGRRHPLIHFLIPNYQTFAEKISASPREALLKKKNAWSVPNLVYILKLVDVRTFRKSLIVITGLSDLFKFQIYAFYILWQLLVST